MLLQAPDLGKGCPSLGKGMELKAHSLTPERQVEFRVGVSLRIADFRGLERLGKKKLMVRNGASRWTNPRRTRFLWFRRPKSEPFVRSFIFHEHNYVLFKTDHHCYELAFANPLFKEGLNCSNVLRQRMQPALAPPKPPARRHHFSVPHIASCPNIQGVHPL